MMTIFCIPTTTSSILDIKQMVYWCSSVTRLLSKFSLNARIPILLMGCLINQNGCSSGIPFGGWIMEKASILCSAGTQSRGPCESMENPFLKALQYKLQRGLIKEWIWRVICQDVFWKAIEKHTRHSLDIQHSLCSGLSAAFPPSLHWILPPSLFPATQT